VAEPGQPGNDRTCDPCRTIAGALARARALPGTDSIRLGNGIYREDVTIDDPGGVWIVGRARGTALRGRVAVRLPPPQRLPGGGIVTYQFDPNRVGGFQFLQLEPTDGVMRVRAATLALYDASVVGRIEAEQAAVSLNNTYVETPSAPPCAAALRLVGAPTSERAGVVERWSAGWVVDSALWGAQGSRSSRQGSASPAPLRSPTRRAAPATRCGWSAATSGSGGNVGIENSVPARSSGFTLGAPGVAPGAAPSRATTRS
jgi:hypothetical protein